jgi:hypothetical protein
MLAPYNKIDSGSVAWWLNQYKPKITEPAKKPYAAVFLPKNPHTIATSNNKNSKDIIRGIPSLFIEFSHIEHHKNTHTYALNHATSVNLWITDLKSST